MNTLKICALRSLLPGTLLLCFATALAPVGAAAADNTFERTLKVSGPVRLELSNASGSVDVRGSADGNVHIAGKVTRGWCLFGSAV